MAIVPSLVLGASFAAVVPAFVVSCSGTDPIVSMKDAKPDMTFYGVAAVAYCCFEAGVADAGFTPDADAGDASDAGDVRDGG